MSFSKTIFLAGAFCMPTVVSLRTDVRSTIERFADVEDNANIATSETLSWFENTCSAFDYEHVRDLQRITTELRDRRRHGAITEDAFQALSSRAKNEEIRVRDWVERNEQRMIELREQLDALRDLGFSPSTEADFDAFKQSIAVELGSGNISSLNYRELWEAVVGLSYEEEQRENKKHYEGIIDTLKSSNSPPEERLAELDQLARELNQELECRDEMDDIIDPNVPSYIHDALSRIRDEKLRVLDLCNDQVDEYLQSMEPQIMVCDASLHLRALHLYEVFVQGQLAERTELDFEKFPLLRPRLNKFLKQIGIQRRIAEARQSAMSSYPHVAASNSH